MSRSTSKHPLVGLVMGSLSDMNVVKPALDLLESWGVPYEVIVASAHRVPERVADWAAGAERRGLEVIIAAAGGAAHLPGVVAAQTTLPVIGLPVDAGPLRGVDSLYSIVQMPPGIPVATVGVNGGVNAAVLSLHILARIDAQWGETLVAYRSKLVQKIDRQNVELREQYPGAVWPTSGAPGIAEGRPISDEEEAEIRSIDLTGPLSAGSGAKTVEHWPEGKHREPAAPDDGGKRRFVREARRGGRVEVDPEAPRVETIEEAVDCLLEGGVIAIPTDTVYGLAVDATNDEAVARLFALKGRSPDRAIAVFIDSQRLLASLVRNLSGDVRHLLEAFWPGPLTAVFERRGEDLSYLAEGPTLGVRLPDHSVPLALMQELCRPIACTSANRSAEPAARTADEVEAYFGDEVNMILDAGALEPRAPSTVIDVSRTPFRMLREGAISRDQIGAVIGDLLLPEEEEDVR